MSAPRRRIGLALGSGAARGWAHIGVIRALEEADVRPDIVAGSSIGAVVGAAYADGNTGVFEDWVRALDRQKLASYFDLAFRGGLIKAKRVFDALEETFGSQTIETMAKPYAAVATDLSTGQEVWLREGPIFDALRASVALPGLITPAHVGDRWLVDGGLVNPVPVSVCRALGADIVIAVDLNTTLVGRRMQGDEDDRSASRRAADRLIEAAPDSFQGKLQDLAADVRKSSSNDKKNRGLLGMYRKEWAAFQRALRVAEPEPVEAALWAELDRLLER